MICTLAVTYMTPTFLIFFRFYLLTWNFGGTLIKRFSLKNAKSKCTKIKSHQIWIVARWKWVYMKVRHLVSFTHVYYLTVDYDVYFVLTMYNTISFVSFKIKFKNVVWFWFKWKYWHLLFYALSPRVFIPYNTRLRVIWSASKYLIQINSFLPVQIFRLVVILV